MATTNKNYSKKSGDRFLTYTLMGFAIAFFALVLSLILYNSFNETLTYDSFDKLTSQSALLSQPESEYLVYYYSEACTYCQEIKSQVLEFADSNNANVKVYFWDAGVIGGTSISAVEGTPAMFTVVNGALVNITNGYIQIPATFDAINAGTYTYIN